MQKVVHLSLCDVCLYRGEQHMAEHSEVVRVGQVERLLETCHEHRAELIGDLADKLRRYGAEVPADHKNGERYIAKPKRRRRTKVEMEAARALAAAESAGQTGAAPEVGRDAGGAAEGLRDALRANRELVAL